MWTGRGGETDGTAAILKAAVNLENSEAVLFAVQPRKTDDFTFPHYTSQWNTST